MTHPHPPATHLCLVSNQPVPSLTPLIDPTLGVKRVLLAATPDRMDYAAWLTTALHSYQISAETIALRDGYNLPSLLSDFTQLRTQHADGLSVNITGGTKLMTIAAWESFNRPHDHLYYVNIHNDSVDWLRPATLAPHSIADHLRMEPYLSAHGAYLHPNQPPLRTPIPLARQQLATQLLRNSKMRRDLHRLRAHIHTSDGGVVVWDQETATQFTRLFKALRAADLVAEGSTTIDNEARAFISGIWLEEVAFATVSAMAKSNQKYHDVVRNLRFYRAGDLSTALINEIDVAFLHDNTLHLIECKTGKMGSNGSGMALGEQIIHKLDGIGDAIGGLRSRIMLISQQALTPSQRKKAEARKIQVIDGDLLHDLPDHLATWVASPLQI